MFDRHDYDPDGVLDRLEAKGKAIKKAFDWWLDDDVAPKLDEVRLRIRLDAPPDAPFAAMPALTVELRSGCCLVSGDITGLVMCECGEDLGRVVLLAVDGLHRHLVDLARRDPERWRRSCGEWTLRN